MWPSQKKLVDKITSDERFRKPKDKELMKIDYVTSLISGVSVGYEVMRPLCTHKTCLGLPWLFLPLGVHFGGVLRCRSTWNGLWFIMPKRPSNVTLSTFVNQCCLWPDRADTERVREV